MAIYSKRALLANTFGTFGYISCLFQWLFVALLYLPLILDNEQIKQFLLPEKTQPVEPMVATGSVSPLLVSVAVIFTVFMMVLTVVMLIRAPFSVAKTGKAITTKAAGTLVPLVVHRPLSAKKRRVLTSHLVKAIKLSLVLMPFLLCFASILVTTALPPDVIVFVSALLAIGSLVWFLIQYLSARLLGVMFDKLV